MRSAESAGHVEIAARSLVARPLFWAVLIAALAAWPLVWSMKTRIPPAPPVLGVVSGFELVDQNGRTFGSKDLAGRVWVASFVETRCGDPCDLVTRQLARVQNRTRQLEPALHLVSFTLDPEHDTPERLSAYARAHRASPRMWSFVTGSAAEVRSVAEEALSLPPTASAPAAAPALGTALVLVDGASRIRGRYGPDDPDVVDRVVRDAALLVNARYPAR